MLSALLMLQSSLLQTFYLKSCHGEIERPILYSIRIVFYAFQMVFPNLPALKEIIMSEESWEVVYETNGDIEAEILKGLLEANEIQVFLSQEGLGRVYGLTVGSLGVVQILVPKSQAGAARTLLRDYDSGELPDSSEQNSAVGSDDSDLDE
jgi:hypothetical protein